MEKNEMDLSTDWHIVSSVYEEKNSDETNTVGSSKIAESETQPAGASVQDVDQEIAALHDSSSSDIDIIDETLEENTTNCVLPSSSLSISSSVDNACDICPNGTSISSSTTSSVAAAPSEDTYDSTPEESKKNEHNEKEESEDHRDQPFTIGGRTVYDWLVLLIQFIENMNGRQLCFALASTICLYFCITINITNFVARQERGNVVSQMKEMIDELKSDNKILRDQMLSEMKNDKMFSSFEHQIRELKKENSRLNHMLFDVVKVLEKQKDSQEKIFEKKEAEYSAPFKKEINKLKEHINILKFDNEELQKQLVRMRYASYSQGGKHTDDTKGSGTDRKEKKADGTKDPESEIPLDQLKKWNELVDMLAKELGLEKDPASKEGKYHEYKRKKDWGWNDIKSNLKGTFGNLPNINISDLLSKYMKYNEKTMSDLYKSITAYFSNAQENAKQAFDSFNFEEQNLHVEQKNNIWDTLKDLGGKWAQMKNKFYTSYLKNSFSPNKREFEKSGASENIHKGSDLPKMETNEPKEKTSDTFKAEKQDKELDDLERNKWLFERAAHRAQSREGEEESSENWFLRKGKHFMGNDGEGIHREEDDSAARKRRHEL